MCTCCLVQSLVTTTLFLRTNLHPDSISSGQEYFGVIFFSLIATMFDGFAEETLTVRFGQLALFCKCSQAWLQSCAVSVAHPH